MDKALVKKSWHLSKVLRHDPGSVGLKLDAAGWVNVDELLTAMKLSRDDLEQVVAENDKKRFEFNADRTRIRASQGHSVDVGEMARAGTKFYRSTNGVWLTDHVPARYLRFGQETGS
jgi:RNA:NAD 2'-phosphotransferase (TPT1/KptA family)